MMGPMGCVSNVRFNPHATVFGSGLRILGDESYDITGGNHAICRQLPMFGQQRHLHAKMPTVNC